MLKFNFKIFLLGALFFSSFGLLSSPTNLNLSDQKKRLLSLLIDYCEESNPSKKRDLKVKVILGYQDLFISEAFQGNLSGTEKMAAYLSFFSSNKISLWERDRDFDDIDIDAKKIMRFIYR